MSDVWQGFKGLLARTVSSPSREAAFCRIPAARVDVPVGDRPLDPEHDYLEVRVVRVHLAHGREWFTRYDPVVFAAVEFGYDGVTTVVPRVVGPDIIQQLGGQTALRTTVANTRVVGPQRIAPGGVAVTMVLSRVPSQDLLQPLLTTLQDASSALDLAAGLLPFTSVARVVVNGVTALTSSDSAQIARRDEFRPVTSGHYALVDHDDPLDPAALRVRDGRLWVDDDGTVRPLDDADYVLYTIGAVPADEFDLTRLPLNRLWQAVLTEAAKSATEPVWESAKMNMASLMGMLATSPDLTPGHAALLMDSWESTMVTLHKRAVRQSHLAPDAQAPGSSLDAVRARALATLRL